MVQTEIQDLEARIVVNFPHLIGMDELESMFDMVSRGANCEFDYKTVVQERRGRIDPETGRLANEKYVKEIIGFIARKNGRSVSFRCELDNDHEHPKGPQTRVAKLRFLITPGYTLAELNGKIYDDSETMDAVREQIGRYFAAHPAVSKS